MSTTTARIGTVDATIRRRVWNIFLWVLQIAAAGMFLSAGAGKLLGDATTVQAFEAIGFGQWFRYVTGGIEVIGAVLLVIPRLAGAGALLLAAVMVGAILTHLFLVGGSAAPALILLLALTPIAWARRGSTLSLWNHFSR